MATGPFETAEAAGYPTVRQLSVFLENRLGQLLRLAKLFEHQDIKILALSVVHSVDCAVIRLLVDNPDAATEVLRDGGFPISEAELIVVSLPPGRRGLLTIWSALLEAEVNISYTYPLLVHPRGRPAVAIHVDNLEMAEQTLVKAGFEVIDQATLQGLP